MRSSTVLLLLGAVPALSWVIPDENNQHVFEILETEQGKSQSRLHSPEAFVEDSQNFDISWAVNGLRKYMISHVHDINDGLGAFFDDAWTSSFETSDLHDGYATTRNKKHGKSNHDNKKHRDEKHRKDKHDDDNKHHKDRNHHSGCHCGEPEEPPHPRPPMPPSDRHNHTNSTIWEMISSSKHSRFADLVKKDHEIMNMLNDKKANVTVFAPNNHAFTMLDKFLKRHKDIPKDLIHRVLLYHIAPGTHESQDLRYHNTLITKLSEENLGKNMHQRLRIGLDHKGPNINFYSRFTMFDIYCENGVVHAVNGILLPPPDVLDLIGVLPTEFSTTEAALERTGLLKEFPKLVGHGMTFFAPSNRDWKRLGLKINAFLFSKCGNKYLRALMKYHIAPNCTLYSDALACNDDKKDIEDDVVDVLNELDDPDGLLHGYTHVYLPTLLDERHISVDITRWERFLSFRVNGMSAILVSDGIAKSGSIQVPNHVLIPPHSLGEHRKPPEVFGGDQSDGESEGEAGLGPEEYSVRQLKEILEPFVVQEQKELEELELQRLQRWVNEL